MAISYSQWSLVVVLEVLNCIYALFDQNNYFWKEKILGWLLEMEAAISVFSTLFLISLPVSVPQPCWPPCCSLSRASVLRTAGNLPLPSDICRHTHNNSLFEMAPSQQLSLPPCRIAPAYSSAVSVLMHFPGIYHLLTCIWSTYLLSPLFTFSFLLVNKGLKG